MRPPLFFLVAPLIAAALIAAAPATLFANCAGPTGLKGEIIYNDDFATMQFCDGSNWVSMSASGTAVESDPQVDQLTASKWCKANAGGTAIDCISTTVDATASGFSGYVQFNSSGTLGSDSALFWDNTNKRLGIGTTVPGTAIDVAGTVTATLFSGSGASLTALNASNLGSGTIPDGRFPATLPAASGANLTALNASNLASGTIPDARFPATLPAISGANLTSLNASNLGSGTVPAARLGSGTADNTSYLRGDQTWQTINLTPGGSTGHVQFNNAGAFGGVAALFWDNSNSRLGIGTAAPAYPLEVSGKSKSVTVLLTPGSGGAPQGTGSATYWNQAGTDLYYMTGNVGIGTATPAVKLDVVGSQNLSGNLSVGGTLSSTGNFSVATSKLFVNASTGAVGIGTASPGATLHIRGGSTNNLKVDNDGSQFTEIDLQNNGTTKSYWYWDNTNSVNKFGVASGSHAFVGGNVGIGTTTVPYPLTIYGQNAVVGNGYSTVGSMYSGADAVFGHNVYADTSSRVLKQLNTGHYASWIRMYYNDGIFFGTSTAAGTAGDTVDNPNSGYANIRMAIKNNGNVGIGTTSPAKKLDVSWGASGQNGLRLSGYVPTVTLSSVGSGYSSYHDYHLSVAEVTDNTTFALKDETAGTYPLVVNGSGNVGIGTWSPQALLHVQGNFTATGSSITFPGVAVAGGYYLCLNNATGWSVQVSNGSCTHSDIRLKKDIKPLDIGPVMEMLTALRPVSFRWKDTSIDSRPQYGLIAQEVEKVAPNLVSTDKQGMKRLNYEGLTAPMIKGIQELKAANDNQATRIQYLEDEIAALKAAVKRKD